MLPRVLPWVDCNIALTARRCLMCFDTPSYRAFAPLQLLDAGNEKRVNRRLSARTFYSVVACPRPALTAVRSDPGYSCAYRLTYRTFSALRVSQKYYPGRCLGVTTALRLQRAVV